MTTRYNANRLRVLASRFAVNTSERNIMEAAAAEIELLQRNERLQQKPATFANQQYLDDRITKLATALHATQTDLGLANRRRQELEQRFKGWEASIRANETRITRLEKSHELDELASNLATWHSIDPAGAEAWARENADTIRGWREKT